MGYVRSQAGCPVMLQLVHFMRFLSVILHITVLCALLHVPHMSCLDGQLTVICPASIFWHFRHLRGSDVSLVTSICLPSI